MDVGARKRKRLVGEGLRGAVATFVFDVGEVGFFLLLFAMLEDLIDDESAGAADECADEAAVVVTSHRADCSSCAGSSADGLHGARHWMVELSVGTDDVLIGAEGFVEFHFLNQVVESRRGLEHVAQHLRRQLAGRRGRRRGEHRSLCDGKAGGEKEDAKSAPDEVWHRCENLPVVRWIDGAYGSI